MVVVVVDFGCRVLGLREVAQGHWEVVVVNLGRRGAQGQPPQPGSLLMWARVAVPFWGHILAVGFGRNF